MKNTNVCKIPHILRIMIYILTTKSTCHHVILKFNNPTKLFCLLPSIWILMLLPFIFTNHGSVKLWQIKISPKSSCSVCETLAALLFALFCQVFFFFSICVFSFSISEPFKCLLCYFTMQTILQCKNVGVAILNLQNLVTLIVSGAELSCFFSQHF